MPHRPIRRYAATHHLLPYEYFVLRIVWASSPPTRHTRIVWCLASGVWSTGYPGRVPRIPCGQELGIPLPANAPNAPVHSLASSPSRAFFRQVSQPRMPSTGNRWEKPVCQPNRLGPGIHPCQPAGITVLSSFSSQARSLLATLINITDRLA